MPNPTLALPTNIFELTVQGKAEIPHPAERAVINLSVASSGTNKAAVSDEVITTAKHVESLLRELSPKDDTAEAKEIAALAHWSKTSLSSTSHIPYDKDNNERPRRYNANITFDIRFKDFKALGSFGTQVASLAHVEVQDIDWTLAPNTLKSFHSQLRKDAAKDAIDKARDYCEAFGCKNLRPIELNEGTIYGSSRSGFRGGRQFASAAQGAPGMRMARAGTVLYASADVDGGTHVENQDLEFDPQEIKMGMDVTVKFHADHA